MPDFSPITDAAAPVDTGDIDLVIFDCDGVLIDSVLMLIDSGFCAR